LLAGYSADVEIIIERHRDVLRVPTEAVLEGDEVYVFDAAAGVLERRGIATGLSNWDHTEVLQGLVEGEQVVTSVGREGLADGVQARLDSEDGE